MSLLAVTSGDIASGVVEAEGVDFDGVNDYLSRAGGLGIATKTVTFSGWVYNTGTNLQLLVGHDNTYNADFVNVISNSDGTLGIVFGGSDGGGSNAVSVAKTNVIPMNTWTHILFSFDAALTTGRLYINDIYTAIKVANVNVNLNAIDTSYVGRTFSGIKGKGRLSNLFLDYTYRDLSIEANRRLFITADGKPTPTATLKALNPILYLPMKDAATAHINEGTGGNFTLNGTIATSNRGANQDNCVASYFDGSADYLSRTSLTGVADGKQFTFSCSTKVNVSAQVTVFVIGESSTARFQMLINSLNVQFVAYNSSGVAILSAVSPIPATAIGKNIAVSISIDLSNSLNRLVMVNNTPITMTWTTYTNDTIDFLTSVPKIHIGANATPASWYNGNIGELYFDTKYIDLATSNPFWDSETNKPIPVRKAMANLGSNPLICMPIDASNPTKNYGTGGDFTLNGGGLVGARGASEFWARSAKFEQYVNCRFNILDNTNLATQQKATMCMCFNFDFTSNPEAQPDIIYRVMSASLDYQLGLKRDTDGFLYLYMNGYQVFKSTSQLVSAGVWYTLLVSIDSTQTKATAYLNGVSQSASITLNRSFSHYRTQIAPHPFYGSLAVVYHSNEFVDFSVESNRLKFIDAFGYITDIKEKINNGVIPKPLVHLLFEDTANSGKNNGILGDFMVAGGNLFYQGADVNG